MTIAFTGATGQLGRLVADALLARTDPKNLVALARDPRKATDLADRGVEVRSFDYDQTGTLGTALVGVDRLLLVSGNAVGQRVPQHRAVIEAATQAGVGFVAYTSFLHADSASLIAVAPDHRETERLLAAAPFGVALLRNGWYTENYEGLVRQAVSAGVLLGSTGQGRISSATRQDYAEAAATVLTTESPQPGSYELSGDQSWTLADLAEVTSELSGRPVQFRNVPGDEHRRLLLESGTPAPLVEFLVGTDAAIAAGELENRQPGTLSGLIGHPTTPLTEVVARWV
ncbi:MAG: SDR family oxidoreductase [Propionicimonas sp.]